MSFFGKIGKIAASVIRSPITKGVASGLAVVYPPAGVPAAAAVASANMALDYAEKSGLAGAAGKALGEGKKPAALARIAVKARAQLKAGVPPAQVKARVQAAKRVMLRRTVGKPVPSAHRTQLAAQLRNTKALAAKGDVGAKRALATFKLVSQARKGNPAARKAVAIIAHRWEVGQRVRSRFELTSHGRIRARV